jgi:hypothetical protein
MGKRYMQNWRELNTGVVLRENASSVWNSRIKHFISSSLNNFPKNSGVDKSGK